MENMKHEIGPMWHQKV
jgi:hypothetical protein